MDPATQQAAQAAPEGADQKLKIDKFSDGDILCLKFHGTIDEDFDGKKLAGSVKCKTLILDLANIRKISSFGIREWVDFVQSMDKGCEEIVLLECAPKVVDQLNMVANFAGPGRVFSFYAPYRCDYCDSDSTVLMQVDKDWDVIKSMRPPERPCESCGEPEYFDEDPGTYFSFVATQEPFSLEPEVASFLSSKLNYSVSEAAQRLRIDKIIEGRSTYLRLAGNLDGSFPREKLAEGMEGTVILDVGGVGKIDPAGAAEWRGFLQMITPSSEAIYLLGVPPGFLEKLTKPEDLGATAQVITFAMPYACNKCATTASQIIDVEQHYDVLKFATPPEMRCTDCKNPTVCAATEGLLSHLPTLPKPTISPQTRKFIKEVRERKPEKKKASHTVAEAAAAGRGGSATMIFAAAAVAASLSLAGVIGYNYIQERDRKARVERRDSVGPLTSSSDETRPAWVVSDERFNSYCNMTESDALSCVGVSSYTDNEEDARDEAKEAALEAISNAIGLQITDSSWQLSVGKIFGEVRQVKLAGFENAKDDADEKKYERARREVREGRTAVTESLRRTGGAAVPTTPTDVYWEEYEASSGVGSRYLVFVQYVVPPEQVERLVDMYSTEQSALGATAVSVFPGIAWRYPDVQTGAVITELQESSQLRAVGLSEQYVVTSIQDRQIKDAVAFARIISEEVERLRKEGGNLKMMVKTGDTTQVEYNRPIPRTVKERDPGPSRPRYTPTRPGGTVNTWDIHSSRGGGRDDPTQ